MTHTRLRTLFLAVAIGAGIGVSLWAGTPAAAPDAGRKVFDDHCAKCHGKTGQGDGPDAKRLGFHPRDFTLGAFKCRSTPSGQPPTDEDLARTITVGLPGTPMVPVPELTPDERTAVIAYVKTLSKAFGGPAPSPLVFSAPPPASPELVAEGKTLYERMQCSKCHGATGRGDGPSAATLVDDWKRPIRPYNFVTTKKFKCGNEDRDIFRTLMTGMTGSPMPSFADALAADAAATPEPARRDLIEHRVWAIVAYLRSLTK